MKNLAPILVFTHVRIDKLKKCISSLKHCYQSNRSHLYIISDGAINQSQHVKIKKIRNFIRSIQGFKKVSIIYRKKNFGLAKNIITGVSEIINKHGKIIVLEEDIVVRKDFLTYMNLCLEKYEKNNKIWHISGWNYNVKVTSIFDAYFIRTMNCWGWATWKNCWSNFKKDPKSIINKWSKNKITEFNFDNSFNFYSQVIRNYEKKINTWAIFWYASIFENDKLCVNPKNTLTKNIGIGKDATNSFQIDEIFQSNFNDKLKHKFILPNKISEEKSINQEIKKKIRMNKIRKYITKIKNIFL